MQRVIHLRTTHLGPEEVLAGMKIAVDQTMSSADVARIVDQIEARLRAELPILRRIYIELGTPEDQRSVGSG